MESKPDHNRETVKLDRSDEKDFIEFRSEHLIVRVKKAGLGLEVRDGREKLLFRDAANASHNANTINLVRAIQPKEDFLGLGPRTDAKFSARGMLLESQNPFLISTTGYGLDYSSAGKFTFDLGKSNPEQARTTIRGSDRVEFYFYYGPTPKEIYEERAKLEAAFDYGEEHVNVLSSKRLPGFARRMDKQPNLCLAIAALAHASISGTRVPAVDLDDYPSENARALAQVLPMVLRKSWSEATGLRKQLAPFLITYLQEARERGFPMIHTLPMQYPEDLAGYERTDEFLMGDEFLVAPFCGSETTRTVYFPRGNWTDMRTGKLYPGRKSYSIHRTPAELPWFSRNGAVLPLAATVENGPMEMHYFPKLGGEFFIWEPEVDFISQLHASPALDYYRVESETKIARVYEWVLHHVEPVERVHQVDGQAFERVATLKDLGLNKWYFDADKKELRVRHQAVVDGHEIINIFLAGR